MRKSVEFSIFGNNYRLTQFAAVTGLMLVCEDDAHGSAGLPLRMLAETDVWTTDGWVALRDPGAIDRFVTDSLGMVNPVAVLDALCAKVHAENFGFLAEWKPVEIPRRLVVTIDAEMEAPRMDPVISLVVMAGKATLRELEEYYSTEDVFKMYDMIAVDNLNKALGSESAMAEAKAKGKRS